MTESLPAIQPTAARGTSLTCSSLSALPPCLLLQQHSSTSSAQPQSLSPASESPPRTTHRTTHNFNLSSQPQASSLATTSLEPHARPTPRDRSPRPTRLATAQPARHMQAARTLLSPATAAQTHPHRPTQAPPVMCLSSVPAFAMLVAASVAPTWGVAHSQLEESVPLNHPMKSLHQSRAMS